MVESPACYAVVLEWLNHQPAGFARRLLASVSRWKPPKNRSHRFRPPPPAAPGHVEGGHSVRQALGKLRSALTGVSTPTGHSPWDGASLCFQVPPVRKGGHGGPGQSNRVYIHFLVKKNIWPVLKFSLKCYPSPYIIKMYRIT